MIKPEQRLALIPGLRVEFRESYERVPAAGHLGVVEEECPGHAHWALEYASWCRCSCGAVL